MMQQANLAVDLEAPSPSPAHVRAVEPADADAILALFADEVAAGRMLQRRVDEIRHDADLWRVAEHHGRIVGCGSLVPYGSALAEVRSLAVASESRGSGIGAEIVRALLQLATERGFLEVLTLTRRATFFERLGFTRRGIDEFPDKVRRDCAPCPLRDRCDEIALSYSCLQEVPG